MRQRRIRIIIDATTNLSFKDIKSGYRIEFYAISDGDNPSKSLIGTITYPNIHQIEIKPVKKENKDEV